MENLSFFLQLVTCLLTNIPKLGIRLSLIELLACFYRGDRGSVYMSIEDLFANLELEEESSPQACWLELRCLAPDANGEMKVDMNYEGDPELLSYLIEKAAEHFDANV